MHVSEQRNYVKYTFLRVDPAWRRRSSEERAADKREFTAACREFGEDHFLRAYSLVGTRGDCDLMVRAIARTVEPIHPRVIADDGPEPRVVLPGDPDYPA